MTPAVFSPSMLQPGDTLLYRPARFSVKGFAGWLFGHLIALKTWHNISHCEVYLGLDDQGLSPAGIYHVSGRASLASRDGLGVNVYPLRVTELAYVLRPMPASGEAVNLAAGVRWFKTVQGEGYDWLGLTRFVRTSITPSTTKMFCSAFWLRFYRACWFTPFSARIDADSLAPGEILDCPKLDVVWSDGRDRPSLEPAFAPA